MIESALRSLHYGRDPGSSRADTHFQGALGFTVVYCSLLRCDGVTVAKANAKGLVPTGIVATTVLVAVSITEMVSSVVFVT
jgi:hypothetical protein